MKKEDEKETKGQKKKRGRGGGEKRGKRNSQDRIMKEKEMEKEEMGQET